MVSKSLILEYKNTPLIYTACFIKGQVDDYRYANIPDRFTQLLSFQKTIRNLEKGT